MKSVTEFWNTTLSKGVKAKEGLVGEGKSPEEIQSSLGETFKMDGDKLKHFINAIEVAIQHPEKLSRVKVVQLAEGESAPPKSTQIEEHYYVPDFQVEARKVVTTKIDPKAQSKGKGRDNNNRTKTSPWGITPEEKAAKKAGAAKAAKSQG